MNIKDFRHRIAIQAEQPTADGGGGYALAWTTLATVWANIKPSTAKELVASGHIESHVTHTITVRWRRDIAITPDMRVLYQSRTFAIRGVVNPNESNKWTVLLAEEGGAV